LNERQYWLAWYGLGYVGHVPRTVSLFEELFGFLRCFSIDSVLDFALWSSNSGFVHWHLHLLS